MPNWHMTIMSLHLRKAKTLRNWRENRTELRNIAPSSSSVRYFTVSYHQTINDAIRQNLFLDSDAFRRIKLPEITGARKAFWVTVPSCLDWSWLLSHSARISWSVWEKVAHRYTSLKSDEVFNSSRIKVPLRALEKSMEGTATGECLCQIGNEKSLWEHIRE